MSLNNSLATKGTNNLTQTANQDKICNIWDISSNTHEWSTETFSYSSIPCTFRGGMYSYDIGWAGDRYRDSTTISYDTISFRVLLYL